MNNLRHKVADVFDDIIYISNKLSVKIKIILLSLFIIISSTFIYIQNTEKVVNNEQIVSEIENVKNAFSKIMILPENEDIEIRKITEKIDNPFFKNAELNDYLIIFYKTKIAYIYSLNKNMIINAGVVNLEINNKKTK